MSPPDSTTGEKDLQPYWSDYTRAISSHLWLPTGTASPASAQNSSSKSSNKTVANSWFSTSEISAPQRNSPRIYSPSLLSSLQGQTDSEGTGRKSRKIRICPDRQQKAKLKLWFDAARFTYNRTIELLTSDGAQSVLAENQEGYPHPAAPVDQARPLRGQKPRDTGRMPGSQCGQEVQQATQDRQGQGHQAPRRLRPLPLPER